MSTFSELVKDLDPEALRLKMALEAHLKTASHALDEAKQAEAQARSIRDGLLADLQQRLDQLADGDERSRADLALERATINAEYRPAANALSKAEDNLADAERDLKATMAEEAQHPILSPY